MKIDSALIEFTEKYSPAMLESIDKMSNELGYQANGYKMVLFNLTESVNAFSDFLKGYKDYQIKFVGQDLPLPQSEIFERTEKFINSEDNFKESAVKYHDLPAFIKSYVESIKIISDTTDMIKSEMTEAGVNPEYIGDTNQLVDQFTEKLQDEFYPVMEKMLWASGYNAGQRLANAGRAASTRKTEPIFI